MSSTTNDNAESSNDNPQEIKVSYNDEMKDKDKSTTNGYIREAEEKSFTNDSFYKTIPMIINYLCMKYYHESKDRFHPTLHGDGIKVSNNTATKIKDFPESAFLSNIVSSGLHKWKFKLNNAEKDAHFDRTNVYIGIWNANYNGNDVLTGFQYDKNRQSGVNLAMGLKISDGSLRDTQNSSVRSVDESYCPFGKTGDIVEMMLDFKSLELSFSVNNKDYGKAFDIQAAPYRATILVGTVSQEVQLLSYDAKN